MVARYAIYWALTISLCFSATAFAAGGAKPNKTVPPTRTAAKRAAGTTNAKAPAPLSPPKAPAAKPAAGDEAPQAGTKSYKLRYKFKPGEILRWEVEHRVRVRTTISGSTQTAETLSDSTKQWKVQSIDAAGNATLVHSVEHVSMWQKSDGRQETRYDSKTDAVPPPVYENVAKAVGVPLVELTLDPRGTVTKREERVVQATPLPEHVTLPLPENAVAVGEEWTMPADISINLPAQQISKKIKARQLYRLESVDDGIAHIHMETQVLTPVNDPIVESQLVQAKTNGSVRFDIDAGRILSQQNDIDEHVAGFQGPGSNMHYVMRFTEKLLPEENRAALGPQPPQRK
jgi:hypothetical protein